MDIFKTVTFLVLLILQDFSACALKAYPRHSRSERIQMKREEPNYFELFHTCNGYDIFNVTPASLVSPDDHFTVSMIESSMSFERNSSSKPDPFFTERFGSSELIFCLGGGKRLDVIDNGDGSMSLIVVSAVEESSYYFYWKHESIRESHLTGNYIVDVAVNPYSPDLNVEKCCLVTLVDYNLTMSPENCRDCINPGNVIDGQLLTFHALRFVYPLGPNDIWFGLFILCADRECKERVVEMQHNEEIIPLKPMVLITQRIPM